MTTPLTTRLIETSLGTLSVRIGGVGPTTVFWHGMFVDSTTWEPMLAKLGGPRRVILINGPGHGLSAPLARDSSIAESAAVALEVIDALRITEPVDWVGNAWGGHVGLQLAATAPERIRSLVAVGSPTEPITDAARSKLGLLLRIVALIGLRGPARSGMLASQLTDESLRDPAILGVVSRAVSRPPRSSVVRAVRSFIIGRTELTSALPSITAPTLIVATDDREDFTPEDARAAAALLPAGDVEVIDGARTLVPLERPAELASTLEAFWAKTRARSTP